jgi:auxin efflux carrier family protein
LPNSIPAAISTAMRSFLAVYIVLGLLYLSKSFSVRSSFVHDSRKSNLVSFTREEREKRFTPLKAVSVQASASAASVKALAKLISTCGIGVWAAKTGLLDKSALSVLSKLIFGLFQPCLLFVNVASTVAASSSASTLRILPIAAAFQITLGFLIGKVVSLVMYGSSSTEESRQLLTCTTFGNSGPLPLVFADALLRSHADPILHSTSVGYISLYLLGWSPLFWIIAPGILANPDDKTKKGSGYSSLVSRIFSPPILGSIFGLLVGISPFRDLFLKPTGMLNPLFESCRTIGAGYLPAVLLVLAGSLLPPPTPATLSDPKPKPEGSSENLNFAKQIFSIYAARFFITPMIGFTLIKFLKNANPMFAALLSDKILLMVLLLETCMPSAQNSTVILQLAGNSSAAAKMARVLLSIYVLGVPAMSYWIASILKIAKLV